MHPIEQSLSLLKARQFRYGAGVVHPDKSARGVAGTFKRENFVTPGPMPGLVYLRNIGQGNDLMYDQPVAGKGDKMVTEAEAEAYWPSHISQRTFMAPTMRGLGLDADAAAFRMEGGRYAPPDTDFHEQKTMDRFTESIAPVMAHETMHGLDSDFSRGSFDQVELPAHILEVATREAQKAREGRFEPEPIIPKASQLLADRPQSGQPPNPDYEFDLTSEPIVTGEPMSIAWQLLKARGEPKKREEMRQIADTFHDESEVNHRERVKQILQTMPYVKDKVSQITGKPSSKYKNVPVEAKETKDDEDFRFEGGKAVVPFQVMDRPLDVGSYRFATQMGDARNPNNPNYKEFFDTGKISDYDEREARRVNRQAEIDRAWADLDDRLFGEAGE
jgi:hypothetical protein|tara:strand:- start:2653 stop:3819 length:1167 start_codon:yes stop_codon:yes gene_type:complete